MKINKVHCLFEQSGTFKKEFQKLGIPAEDYDIADDFGETDHVVDLFGEIEKAYVGESSLFDSIGECDLVFAFFPCTRFAAKNSVNSRGEGAQFKKYTDVQKLEYSMKLNAEIGTMYTLICKLFAICLRGGWRMIVENPYTQPHYLTYYFPIKPSVIDKDRSVNGDHFRKPTQYWFLNFEPRNNVVVEPCEFVQIADVDHAYKMDIDLPCKVKRSLIHPQYARRFIISHVIDCDGGVWTGEAI